ncbi:WD40 repeat-like protein [Suillus hirtellus]|nr:WD40 repeat-like protein [Suillus hirtellus]
MSNHAISPQALTPLARKKALQAEMTLKGHEDWVRGIAFIPGTRLLVTCSDDKSLRLWNLDTGQQVGKPLLGHSDYVLRVAVSPDGRWIVSGSRDGSILVWEVPTTKSLTVPVSDTYKGHRRDIWSVVFAPDSKTFASASYDKTVCVWQRETGKISLGPFQMGGEAYSVSYSPDGSKLAAGAETHIILWDSTSGEELLKIEQRAWLVTFTLDGLHLISGSFNDIRISHAATGEIIKQFDVHTDLLRSLAIAPDGTKFATASSDKTTRFFDLTTLEPFGEPLEYPDALYCVTFSEDSQFIATGCVDKLVRIWEVDRVESEEFKQSVHKDRHRAGSSKPDPRQKRAGVPRGFFDNFDMRSQPQHNIRTVPTTSQRHAEGSHMKRLINRLSFRSSTSESPTPRTRKIDIVDIFATRGKYRNANAISGKRHLARPSHPPRKNARTSNTGVPRTNASAVGMSNITTGAASASMRTTTHNASAMTGEHSPPDAELVPETKCLTVLARWFLCGRAH